MSFRATETNVVREPVTSGVRIQPGVLVAGTLGGWAIDTDPRATATATLVAGTNGGFAADGSLPPGSGTVLRTTTRTIMTV